MPTREEQKARTYAAILVAARDLFVSRGFAKTTVRDIARAAGVGVGSIHVHFHDKRSLLRACFRDQIAGAVSLGLDTLDRTAPLPEQLVHLARVLFAAYARHPALSRQMFVDSLFPEGGDNTQDLLEQFLAEVVGLFQAALQAGTIQRLPEDGVLAAQGYFSLYVTVLMGGLAGVYGPPDAPGAAERWGAALRRLLGLQLVGLGAPEDLLSCGGEE